MSRYRFIDAQRDQFPVQLLYQLVQVPTSGYYAWQWVQRQGVTKLEPAWETPLVKVFGAHQRCYGTLRFQVELRKNGYRVGRQRLRAAMRRRGLHALQPIAFMLRTPDSRHGLRCAPNRLLGQPLNVLQTSPVAPAARDDSRGSNQQPSETSVYIPLSA